MSNITLWEAAPNDLTAISNLARPIWEAHYRTIISQAQIDYMLHRGYTVESLQHQWAKGQRFLLARADAHPVAYAGWSIKSDGKETWVHLNKLYALESARGTGVGRLLLERVIAETRQRGIPSIRLNVNKHNPTCAWYFRRGFTIQREVVLDIGNGYVMDDYILILHAL